MSEVPEMTWKYLGARPAFFPSVGLVLGALLGPIGPWPAGPWVGMSVVFLLLAGWRGTRVGGLLALLFGAFTVGAALAVSAAEPMGVPLDGAAHLVGGELMAARHHDEGDSILLDVDHVDGHRARFMLSLGIDGTAKVMPGQRLQVRTVIRQRSFAVDDALRFAALTRRAGGYSSHVSAESLVTLTGPQHLDHVASWLHERTTAAARWASLSPTAEALVLTLAAGERARLQPEREEAFAASGLAHVLSVSGLHVAVLAMAVFWACRRLLTRWPSRALRRIDPRRIAGPMAVPWVWAYVAFTGWQPPAIRSGAMVTLVLLSFLVSRRSDALNALSLAAGAMVVGAPEAPLDLSVQLSFVAVLSLIVVAPVIRQAIALPRPDPRLATGWHLQLWRGAEALLGTALASLAVTLATAPLLIETFGRVGWVGVVSNVVALPLCSVLVLLCATGAIVSPLSLAVGGSCFWAAGWLAEALDWLALFFARWPGASVYVVAPPWWVALTAWVGLGVMALASGRNRWFGAAALGVTVGMTWWVQPRHKATEVAVTFLSVGHGDAIIVSAGNQHALIDAGGVPHGPDVGERVVLPALRQRGIERLELVVLTHAHPDHALGLVSVLQAVPTRHLWLPTGTAGGGLIDDVEDAAEGALVERVGRGHTFALGMAHLEVLSPDETLAAGESENDRSLVIRLEHENVSFLFTGDVEAEAEQRLPLSPVTVLKAPHHGSRTSSTSQFVNKTKPQSVIFSVGLHNRFGFPHADVVERYRTVGSRLYRTDLDGSVRVTSDGHQAAVTTEARSRTISLAARRRANRVAPSGSSN
jgi:competence protein ComEC